MIFRYQALNAKGENVSGDIDAQSEAAAKSRIRAQGIYPVKLWKQENIVSVKNSGDQKTGKLRELAERISAEISLKFSSRQIGLFSRQLATLLKAGLPLLTAITAIMDQIESRRFRTIIADVKDKLEEGSSFSNALARQGSVFSDMYINMVRVGENLGSLDQVMERLAEMSEKGSLLKSKIRAALYYPAFMFIFALIVVIFLLVNVIPSIAEMFNDQERELPLPTEIVIGISSFLSSWWFLIPAAVILLILGFRKYSSSPAGRKKLDALKMKIPVFSILYRKILVLKFTQNLGVLLANKVDIIKAFEIVSRMMNNSIAEERLTEAAAKIKEGSAVSAALAKAEFLPKLVLGMIAAGESSDNLDSMLINIGHVYETELDLTVSSLTSLIEPLIIIFMGIIIGVIVLSVMLPIMEMNFLVQ